ncbi:MAG: FAD-binding domain-containing protein [Rhodospirillaceae bacterium]
MVPKDSAAASLSFIDTLPGLDLPADSISFTPTRSAGMSRLELFVGRTGHHYANHRNYDYGPEDRSNISVLSPWIRHRLITEEEVLRATLLRQSPSAAEKFIQEVFWRGYFKGWLEQRPSVWTSYQADLSEALQKLDHDAKLKTRYEAAVTGRTGIDCFDAWAQELVQSGYLHNHARMWFASIWIFTLRLPWTLGADFFLRHLLDGDPASNTLSWRWVAGLHTKGKTYLARRENIVRYTEGRFVPRDLSPSAEPLQERQDHPRRPLPASDPLPTGDYLLLVTEEDCRLEESFPIPPAAVLGAYCPAARSPLPVGEPARTFAVGAVRDGLGRLGSRGAGDLCEEDRWAEAVLARTHQLGLKQVVSAYAPVGPTASRLAALKQRLGVEGVTLSWVRRPYDSLTWPHATKGFFALKQKIPSLLAELGLA